LDNPEFRSNELAKKFYGILDNEEMIVNLLSSGIDSSFETEDFKIYIGNSENGLKDLSIIAFKNEVNGKDMGTIGIIGPTRMNYSKVISVLKYINKKLNEGEKIENIKIPLMLGNGNIRFLEDHKKNNKRRGGNTNE
jgi:heat-inducible transcription repressor hrcA